MTRYLAGSLLVVVALAWLVAGTIWPPAQLDGWGAVPAGLIGGAGTAIVIARAASRR